MSYGVTNSSPTSLATCLDPMFGSTTVFVNDGGVSKIRVNTTVTGGQITGPGSAYVTCEDQPVSVAGDAITAHPPCPLPPAHCAAFTTGSSDVFTGGIYPPAGSIGSGASPGQPILAQLVVTGFTAQLPAIAGAGNTYTLCVPAPTGPGPWPGPIVFDYSIHNQGVTDTGPFKIGLYEVLGLKIEYPPLLPLPSFITITQETPFTFPNIVPIDTRNISGLAPDQSFGDTWSIPLGNPFSGILLNTNRYYILAVDTLLQVVEPIDYDNSSPVVAISCIPC